MIETVIFIPIYNINADFAALHRYDWLPSPKIKSGDPKIQYGTLTQARVKRRVEEQLDRKGYVWDAGQPDFLVTYINELYGYGPGWGTV